MEAPAPPAPAPAQPGVAPAPAGALPLNNLADLWQQHAQQFLFPQQQQHVPPAPGLQNPPAGGTAPAAGPTPTVPSVGSTSSAPGAAPPTIQSLPQYLYPLTLTPLVPLSGLTSTPSAYPGPLDHLTDDELRNLEGTTREAIINRMNELAKVQSQITGVITQLAQISQLMGSGGGVSSVGPNAGEQGGSVGSGEGSLQEVGGGPSAVASGNVKGKGVATE
ncbi:hypothetical protein HDV00_001303 [Rhizophlyctis rosea]|nr:hypothetical protein HDV00_001303 [Rhizophlyctis rosea]